VDFGLGAEQLALRRKVRDFARQEIRPRAGDWDEKGGPPPQWFREMGRIKVLGLMAPEECGGGGLDRVSYATALIEISKASASIGAAVVVSNSLYCSSLMKYGSGEQRRKYLSPCASGSRPGSWALIHEREGSSRSGAGATASREGDDWVICGKKDEVWGVLPSSCCILTAWTDKGTGPGGLSSFVVDLEGAPGVKAGRLEHAPGVGVGEIFLDHARVPADALLGKEGEGLSQSAQVLQEAWIGMAAQAVGTGRGVLEEVLAHVGARGPSGNPVASSQSIQWKLADIATDLEASELLTLRCAWLADQGKPFEKEAAMAMTHASRAALRACVEGLQILPGRGDSEGLCLEKRIRQVTLWQSGDGPMEKACGVVARNLVRGK